MMMMTMVLMMMVASKPATHPPDPLNTVRHGAHQQLFFRPLWARGTLTIFVLNGFGAVLTRYGDT